MNSMDRNDRLHHVGHTWDGTRLSLAMDDDLNPHWARLWYRKTLDEVTFVKRWNGAVVLAYSVSGTPDQVKYFEERMAREQPERIIEFFNGMLVMKTLDGLPTTPFQYIVVTTEEVYSLTASKGKLHYETRRLDLPVATGPSSELMYHWMLEGQSGQYSALYAVQNLSRNARILTHTVKYPGRHAEGMLTDDYLHVHLYETPALLIREGCRFMKSEAAPVPDQHTLALT